MQTNNENGYKQTINIPLNLNDDFSIETNIDFNAGDMNSGHGLIWGFKDWENCYYFCISANGYFQIAGAAEGINLDIANWTQSDKIKKNYQSN